MRQKLNENPVAQIALIGMLVLIVGYFVLNNLGGGESEGGAETAAPRAETATGASEEAVPTGGIEESAPVAATSAVSAPSTRPLPKDIEAAYGEGKTIVLLIYRPGGIDDKLTSEAAEVIGRIPDATLFEAKVGDVARYAAITGPLGVSQAPALIVVRSGKLNNGGSAPATVTYGFQTASDIRQAIVDSRYRGPEFTYAPN